MDLEPTNVLGCGGIRRATKECRKAGDVADVIALGLSENPRTFMSSIKRWRSGLPAAGEMGLFMGGSSWLKEAETLSPPRAALNRGTTAGPLLGHETRTIPAERVRSFRPAPAIRSPGLNGSEVVLPGFSNRHVLTSIRRHLGSNGLLDDRTSNASLSGYAPRTPCDRPTQQRGSPACGGYLYLRRA